ncbi:ferritin-like domain-containing protein [Solitalea longa]|uniref:Ferritin-like domain-containing protein n=1 Tax=Solitalea longa TaxID=2079460 RepID=A0A2S5A455_9SPHI|nr:DUF892 family protein [Solitalea longa]POY37316.1 ferritin-like domain-containing protein [Solitalea longa]
MKNKNHSKNNANIVNTDLHTLLVNHLKEVYWAEKFQLKNLSLLVNEATSEKLYNAIITHEKETENHIKRIEEVFSLIGEQPKLSECMAIQGLINETQHMIHNTNFGSMVRDVCIIACLQKIEHYEIASYGTLKTICKALEYLGAASILDETLSEEKYADSVLTGIGENYVVEVAVDE